MLIQQILQHKVTTPAYTHKEHTNHQPFHRIDRCDAVCGICCTQKFGIFIFHLILSGQIGLIVIDQIIFLKSTFQSLYAGQISIQLVNICFLPVQIVIVGYQTHGIIDFQSAVRFIIFLSAFCIQFRNFFPNNLQHLLTGFFAGGHNTVGNCCVFGHKCSAFLSGIHHIVNVD